MAKIDDLVQIIEDESLRKELQHEVLRLTNQKKFGLVWEDKVEKVAIDCEKHLPVLRENISLAIESSDSLPTGIIIEGDNYHALSVLNYTHFGAVDVIYIDPPYNTGAKNWRYNNKFVDENDVFKHSKWISFMNKRLHLAKNLLADDGVIVMTIDDYEVENSILLLNEIFGEANHLGTIVIKNNPQGRSSPTGFQISHEYALFYGKSVKKIGTVPRNNRQLARYSECDSLGPFEWRNFRAQYSQESDSMRYPIYVKKDCSDFRIPKLEWDGTQGKFIALEEPFADEIISLPIDEDGRMRTWKWGIDTALESKSDHMGVRLDRSGAPAVYYKGRMKNEGMQPYTIWDNPKYSASTFGNDLLENILGGKRFQYPKSVYAVIDCLKVASAKKNAVILDFFAGSGTTGHAVLKLNKDDGGNRTFILCTNNENNICDEVTYPRIKNIVTGIREDGTEYKEIEKELLYDKKLTLSIIKDSTSLFDEIKQVKIENRDFYSSFSSEIEDNSLRIYGTPKISDTRMPGNVRFFRTNFIEKDGTTDKLRRELSPACEDMIRIREGAYKIIIDYDLLKVYKNSRGLTAIIYDRFDLEEHITKIESLETDAPVHLYVFSYSTSDRSDEMPSNLKHKYENQPIPEGVLEIYKKIFRKKGNK